MADAKGEAMKRTVAFVVLFLVTAFMAGAEPFANPFFAFCMDTHDSQHRTLKQQAELLHELGYAGLGHLWLDDLQERLATADAAGLKVFQVYFRVDITPDKPPYDPRLKDSLPLLRGRDAMLCLLINGLPPSDVSGDTRAVALVREIAGMAKESGVRVVLYPHSGDWLEKVSDAVRVAKKADQPNVGVMFNLCHWLKVDDEANLKPTLEQAMPYLAAVAICGADHAADIHAGKGQMIRPLDTGAFDVYNTLRTLKDLGFKGPVGLQCWGIEGDARDHLTRSIATWHSLVERLNNPPTP